MNLFRTAMKTPEVYPLVGIVTFAGGMAVFMLFRSATTYPDVTWNRRKNPYPWLHVKQTDQLKLRKDKLRPTKVLEVPEY